MEAIVSNPEIPETITPPAMDPVTTPEAPKAHSFEEGGKISMDRKIELAQIFVLGLMAASFIYSIAYYRKKMNETPLSKLENKIDEIENNLRKQLGDKYQENK